MKLNPNWTYREVMKNIREVRKEYILICKSFDYYHLHDKVLYRTEMKRIVYSYPFSEKKQNTIWNSLHRRYNLLVNMKGEKKC